MAGLRDQPKNMNLLADVQFKFELDALPNTTFFVQSTALPGVTLTPQTLGFPGRSDGIARHTGVIEYEELNVAFLVDEYLKNWLECFRWITQDPKHSPAVLTILSSSMNPTLEVQFKDCFPTNLSAIDFDSTTADPGYVQASLGLKYTEYIIKELINS